MEGTIVRPRQVRYQAALRPDSRMDLFIISNTLRLLALVSGAMRGRL